MDSLPFSQAIGQLSRSTAPLLILPRQPDTDSLAAGLALFAVCQRLDKRVAIVSPDFRVNSEQAFLSSVDAVRSEIINLRDFVISVSLKRASLESLRYEVKDDHLELHLTPKNGLFEAKDASTGDGSYAYDTIVLIGQPRLDEADQLYSQHIEFFLHTPTIVLDHRPAAQPTGQIHLLDPVATSSSEIMTTLIRDINEAMIDEQVATNLLAGMLSKTKGFQAPTVTPRALSTASFLLAAGARRQEIVRHLYQTKSVAALQLWGRAMAKLQVDEESGLAWTTIIAEDLTQTKSTKEQGVGVLEEMLNSSQQSRFILFVETPTGTEAHVMVRGGTELPPLPPSAKILQPTYAVVSLLDKPVDAIRHFRPRRATTDQE